MTSKSKTFTYQTRLECPEAYSVLNDYAHLFSKLERTLFANACKGIDLAANKSLQLIEFGVTGRQHNACRIQLQGKIDSYKAIQTLRIGQVKVHIKNLELKLPKIKTPLIFHQKKRRLVILNTKLTQLLADKEKGLINLRLRLPDALKEHGKYLLLPDLFFHNGHEAMLAAIKDCQLRAGLQKLKDPNYIHHGQALNYRFVRDQKGYRIFVSLTIHPQPLITDRNLGVIGIDINADHLAITETDRFGNPLKKITEPLITYGKTKNQSKALIGETVARVIALSMSKRKPIVLEKLDFSKKKCALRETGNSKYSRMLSSFAYEQIKSAIASLAFRRGIEIIEVNPAFTSVIGLVKFSDRYALSKHHAAALSIARRGMGASEKVPCLLRIPDGKGGHVALSLPVRNRDKHVWSQWSDILKKLRAAHAVQTRASLKTRSLVT